MIFAMNICHIILLKRLKNYKNFNLKCFYAETNDVNGEYKIIRIKKKRKNIPKRKF